VALLLAGLCGPALSLGAAGSSPPEPVLAAICYHRFGLETGKDPYRISLARLAGQLEWLRANGWRGVSLTQVAAALDGDPLGLPPKAVLLSVDDGYKAGALGAAVFERYGFHAVYFVVPAMLGNRAFLSYDDLRVLEAKGHEIASHTLTHPDLAKVPQGMAPRAYVRWVDHELLEPKRLLEAALGHKVADLAWPYGAYNPALVAAARRAGYRQLWTVTGGLNSIRTLDRLRLRRILLMGHPSLDAFARRLSGLPLRESAEGISEGDLIYRSQLPLHLAIPKGLRVALGGRILPLNPSGGVDLKTALKNGFHYLSIAQESGLSHRQTPVLFQIAPDAWKPYFDSLVAEGFPALTGAPLVPSTSKPATRPRDP